MHSNEVPFVRIIIPFLTGTILCYNLHHPVYLKVLILINILLILILTGINLAYKNLKAYRFKPLTGLLFSCLCLAFGGMVCLLNQELLNPAYFGSNPASALKVWVSDEPQQKGKYLRLNTKIIKAYHKGKARKAIGNLLITIETDSLKPINLSYGNILMVPARHTAIEPAYNPGEFDFKAWLASKHTYRQAFIKQGQLIKLKGQNGNQAVKFAFNLRQKQVSIFRKIIKDDQAFALASTLILGYRADLSGETLAIYSKTGTIHALSVSGMHVGIIYLVLNWLLFFLERNRRLIILKIIIIISLIWFYTLITGFSPSVLRSAIMLSLYILAKSFNKPTNGYNILAFTAFCLLIYDPFLVWDVGFELSFLSVLGLLYLQPKIYKWCYFKSKWADRLWSTVALSLSAQIATFPLSIYYFHQFPVYFILSNLFILLPVTLLMYLGLVILLFKLYFLAPVFEWMIIFMNDGLKWIADLPFSGISAIWLNRWQLLILCLSLLLLLRSLANYKKKTLLLSLFGFLTFQSLSFSLWCNAIKQRKILFFTLKKDYAVAFISSRQAILLTDLTKNDKVYHFYIKPALAQAHIKNVNFVKWNTDVRLPHFQKKAHQINFYQYRILCYDSCFNEKRILGLPQFDLVWLHQNKSVSVSTLCKEIAFSTLVVDASIKSYQAKKYEAEANKIRVRTYILKKNKAYLIPLNEL